MFCLPDIILFWPQAASIRNTVEICGRGRCGRCRRCRLSCAVAAAPAEAPCSGGEMQEMTSVRFSLARSSDDHLYQSPIRAVSDSIPLPISPRCENWCHVTRLVDTHWKVFSTRVIVLFWEYLRIEWWVVASDFAKRKYNEANEVHRVGLHDATCTSHKHCFALMHDGHQVTKSTKPCMLLVLLTLHSSSPRSLVTAECILAICMPNWGMRIWVSIGYKQIMDRGMHNRRSLEVKLPTIWRDGKAEVGRAREEKSRSEKIREEKEWEARRCRCAKR